MLQYAVDREAVAILSGSALFRGIRPEELVGELLRLGGSRRSIPEGRILASAGDLYERLILVLAGSLLATLDDERGRSLLVGRAAMLELCRRRERFLANLLGILGSRIQGLAAALRTARWSPLRARIAAYLLEQKEGTGRSDRRATATAVIRLPHTREEIAHLVGAERPSVSRSLSALVREGFISSRGREITIIDRPGLKRLTHR